MMEIPSSFTSPEADDVFGLLTKLSEQIVRSDSTTLSRADRTLCVKKVRSSLYATILGKNHVKELSTLSNQVDLMSPLSWVMAQSFALNQSGKESESCELDDAIKEAISYGWDESPPSVLRTLICLVNTSCVPNKSGEEMEAFYLSNKLGVAGVQKGSRHSKRIYPRLSQDIFQPPSWMKGNHSFSSVGRYPRSFPFNCKPGTGLPLFESFNETSHQRNDLRRPIYQLHPIPALSGPRELTFPSNRNQSNTEDEGYFTPMTEVPNELPSQSKSGFEEKTKVWSDALKVSLPARKTWETLGILVSKPEPPFISYAGPYALLQLDILVTLYQDIFNASHSCDPEPTSRADFLKDILLLLTGIASQNFPFDEDSNTFSVREGMWLEGYTLGTFHNLCQDFIFCGTHFRQLEKLAHSYASYNDSSFLQTTVKPGGSMVLPLIGCVQRWIKFYIGGVLILPSHCQSRGNILMHKLLQYIQPLKQQINCLLSLCCVENFEDGEPAWPNSVSLLAHIYREVFQKSDSQQSPLLFSVLKSCCEVYFQSLQKWIFLGYCSDRESDEFFVYKDPLFSTKRERSFWLKGFILDKESVPVFLQGLEVAVFDCGRAMNLLKLCNPNHPLCVLLEKSHPTIHCCLFKSDEEKVRREYAQFEEDVQKVCGEFLNVSKLLEEEQKREANLRNMVREAQKKREIARELLRIQLVKEKAIMKEKQNADLKAQIFEVEKRRAAEKEQQRIEDEQYLQECQRQETALRQLEEKERKEILAHYEEQGRILDKQNLHREWQMKRLRMADKRQTFLYEDSLHLSRDCQLLNTSSVTGLDEVDNIIFSEQVSSTSLTTPDDDNESQESSPLVLECDNQAKKCSDNLEKHDAQHTFKEAFRIKAKVLQVEYGQCFERPLIDPGKPTITNIERETENKSIILSESIAQSERTSQGKESSDEINIQSVTQKTGVNADNSSQSDLEKNREKVLTEDKFWKPIENYVKKETSVDSGVVLDRERNRNRILGGEYNIITGYGVSNSLTNSSCQERPQRDQFVLSDLQKNRRKVLNEEYNTHCGEVSPKAATPVVAQTDSGVDVESTFAPVSSTNSYLDTEGTTVPRSSKDILHSGLSSGHKQMTAKCEESTHVAYERPGMLSVSSDPSVILSPLMTPQGFIDGPVFTSPFKGTNNLPNGLPLASPMMTLPHENVTSSEVNGIPLMMDVADNFNNHFKSSAGGLDVVDSNNDAEVPKTVPWLESSLQSCLLVPLRIQYRHVSSALLHFFLVDLKLISHLISIRSYFLMQDGKFGHDLTSKLFSQMYQVSTPGELLNVPTLDKYMREALASSQGTADPNHSKLCITCSNIPDHFSHSSPNVLDCLQLSYKVKWPLNLILTPESFEKYNMIFLFLVRLKRVAWLLQEDFVALKNAARGCYKEQDRDLLNSPQYQQVQIIRHNMSQFVQATLNYVSRSVLHASWADFATSLKQASTIDHIYNAHTEYIKRLLKRCLLNSNSHRIEVVLSKILRCIINFHCNMRVRPWQLPSKLHNQQTHSTYLEHPNFQPLMDCSNRFKLQVSKLVSYLERLISPPNQQEHLSEYLVMLNMNGFYKSSDYLKHAENVQESDGKSGLSAQTTS